jgi:hypothetical protein
VPGFSQSVRGLFEAGRNGWLPTLRTPRSAVMGMTRGPGPSWAIYVIEPVPKKTSATPSSRVEQKLILDSVPSRLLFLSCFVTLHDTSLVLISQMAYFVCS